MKAIIVIVIISNTTLDKFIMYDDFIKIFNCNHIDDSD